MLPSGLLGGVERSHLELASGLKRFGWHLRSYVPSPSKELADEFTRRELEFERIPESTWWIGKFLNASGNAEDLVKDLARHLSLWDPKVIVSESIVSRIGADAAQALGVPHVWSIHEFADRDHGFVLPTDRQAIGDTVMQLSSAIVCNSQEVSHHFFPANNTQKKVVQVIPYSVEAARQGSRSPCQGLAKIAVIGTLQEAKGQHRVLEILPKIRRLFARAEIHLYGAGSPKYLLRLKQQCRGLGIEDHVFFHGFQANREAVFTNADLVVVPSTYEAYGRVADEAILSEIPVLYAKSGGLGNRLKDWLPSTGFDPLDQRDLERCFVNAVKEFENLQNQVEQARMKLLEWQSQVSPHRRWSELLDCSITNGFA